MKNLIFRVLAFYRRIALFLLRASGRTPEENHARRIVSGRAWNEFCDSLKAAGAALVMPGTPKDPGTQAEGYRYLTRLLRGGLEAFLEHGDPVRPELRRTVHETIKIGADNPDNAYYNAAIRGDLRYRIWGRRGTVARLSFHAQRGSYGSTGGLTPAGKLEADELVLSADGSFEIIASQTRGEAVNWLPLTEDASLFMVRQTFADRSREREAEVHIECIDSEAPPRDLDARVMDQALSTAAAFVAGTSTIFTRWATGFKRHANRLPRFDDAVSTRVGGDPRIAYHHSYWRLRPDEALIIHSRVPDCEFWNFQLNNFWMESLDYRYHRIHINSRTARLNPDGTVTIVVATTMVDHPNALTTVGRRHGTMCFRWIGAEDPPEPGTRVLALADLPGVATVEPDGGSSGPRE